MARVPAKKATARKAPARRAAARKSTARKAGAKRAYVRRAPTTTAGTPRPSATPAPAGALDLAASLRNVLSSMETEIRAVSNLSEQIDELVRQLNDARDEQAKRLLVLDTLRTSVQDANLGAFLDKAIRPRKTRVPEVVPERLAEG
jgi:hypothetical protein